ncbi:type VI secretion system ATPase TssH [Collimonas antrihumi]|uniref:type VI secretion system ATPase TssH n=1 Tax=Collimonas antrihumi TaxID=1940615 RepID=UPI001B8D1BDB|nr:type VI secretion system ATPase TssH [Collimonas antrihumi]
MPPRDSTHLLRKLNPQCASALEAAASLCHARAHGEITLEHWLLKLIEPGTGDIPTILRHYEIDIDQVWGALLASLERLPHDMRGKPALSHTLMDVMQRAWLAASMADDARTIRSAHILTALVDTPHCLRATDAWPLLSMTSAQIQRLHSVLEAQSVESQVADNDESAEAAEMTPPSSDASAATNAKPAKAANRTTAANSEALTRFAIDLTAKAGRGEIDPIFGRDREIQQMVDVLARRRKNNPILVGEPGVGKTALVEGLALRVAEGTVPAVIRDVRILTLDLGLLQAGAGVKGEFEQRLKNVIDEVQQSPVPILLFIDEAHTLIGAGNSAGGADAANLLKPALARGELRTIAATTWSEYKEYFERDAALERRFQVIKVDEPDDANATLMLRGLAARYAAYHNVHIRDEALIAAVKLSRRYLTGRQLPDKAVDLIDTAAARVKIGLESPPAELELARAQMAAMELEIEKLGADQDAGLTNLQQRHDVLQNTLMEARTAFASLQERYQGELVLVNALRQCRSEFRQSGDPAAKDTALTALNAAQQALAVAQGKTPLVFVDVDAQAIARVVAEWTGVPVGSLVEDELAGLLSLEQTLASRVVAQDEALAALASSLRIAKAGLKNEHSPLGVFLLAGPSGVGKTETALALADLLFGGEAALTTINMSEYQEAHTASQLKGAPPGYVGYGRGGVLTEAVRQRPYSVVLLDEVEKAHRDVLEMFYHVFDRGTMRDGEGREINFCNCVILMTSNLGSQEIMEMTGNDPAASTAQLMEAVHPILSEHFQPALLARFQPILYRPLQAGALSTILRIKLDAIALRLKRQYGIILSCNEGLIDTLAQACLLRESGARNIDSLLNQQILPVVARELLVRLAAGGMPDEVRLSHSPDGNLALEFLPDDTAKTQPAALAATPDTIG